MPHSLTPPVESGSAAAPVGVLVVDDQRAVREGLARLIACAPMALHCLGTASNGVEALGATARLRPDVVVLDADLNGEDGLALIPQLAQCAAVLVLSCHGDAATRARATSLGARAFIEKHQPAAELLGAIALVGHPQFGGNEAPGRPVTNHPLGGEHPPMRAGGGLPRLEPMDSTWTTRQTERRSEQHGATAPIDSLLSGKC